MKNKFISLGMAALLAVNLVTPALALEEEIEVPALPGGSDVTITVNVESTEDGTTSKGENISVSDQNGNKYIVDYESTSIDGGDSSVLGSSKSENGNYSAEWGETTTIKENEDGSDVFLDLITDGNVNGSISETFGDASTLTTGTLKTDNNANYDQTTTTTTDKVVSGEVTAITTETTIVTKEDGSKEQITYYYYNAADEDFRWHQNGKTGDAYFETTNNPGLEQSAGVYMLIVEKVVTQLDEDGNPKTDDDGNVLNHYELIPCVYCTDINTSTETGKEYRLVNLEDAVTEGYYSEEDAEHLRAIISLGYDWGYEDWGGPNGENREYWSGEDKGSDLGQWDEVRDTSYLEWSLGLDASTVLDGTEFNPRGTNSLKEFKETLRTAVANGELELTEEQIDSLTRGQAATATQVAIWQFGKRDYTTLVSTKDETVNTIVEWLTKQTKEATETNIIDQEKAIDDMQLVIGLMVKDHENNKDEDRNNDVYDTSLKFSLVVTPDKDKDDLTVKVIDSDGNIVKSGRIAGTSSDPDETYLTPDENGYYIFEGLELQENSDIKFNLTIEGTQYLEEGVYVFKSTNDGKDSQNLITKSSGSHEVNTTTEINLTFNVEESTVTEYHEWRSERIIEKSNTPEPEPEPDIPTPTPEPEEPSPEPEPIPEEPISTPEPETPEVEKDEVPKTGVIFTAKEITFFVLLAVLGALLLRKKED